MIISKRRINTLTCLNCIKEGTRIVLLLNDAMRYKTQLIKLGFSENLEEGERILPSMINPTMQRNAETFYTVDKTKPKEKYTQTLLWTRHEWAGRGETVEVSSYVDIPRERYARIEHKPYGVELFLKYSKDGCLQVLIEPISFSKSNEKMLINTINMFLTVFNECEVLTEILEDFVSVRTKRLNWEILPKGRYPWEKVKKDVEEVMKTSNKTSKSLMFDRCEVIQSYEPDFRAYGKNGFCGYIVFGFSTKRLYVLESVYMNNATYVLGKDWEYLSQLTKAELLNGNLHKARVIHNEKWQDEINRILSNV